jgi:hypothetical protein
MVVPREGYGWHCEPWQDTLRVTGNQFFLSLETKNQLLHEIPDEGKKKDQLD